MPSIDGSLKRIADVGTKCLDTTWLHDRETTLRAELQNALASDIWMGEFPGRRVLSAYVGDHVVGITYEAFRGLVVDKMATAKFQPPGMKATIDQIEVAAG